MVFGLEAHGEPLGVPWGPMGCPWGAHGEPMGHPWGAMGSHGAPMGSAKPQGQGNIYTNSRSTAIGRLLLVDCLGEGPP